MQMWLLARSQLKALTPVAQVALSSQILAGPNGRFTIGLTAADAEFTTGSISSGDFMTPQLFRMRILCPNLAPPSGLCHDFAQTSGCVRYF
jgi:hypothetical protein